MIFKDTLKQKYKHDKYPQVRKTGVDAVHESCPERSNMTCSVSRGLVTFLAVPKAPHLNFAPLFLIKPKNLIHRF